MEGDRVRSKHLFNFPLAGVVDDDILEREKEWVEQMGDKSMEDMNSEMGAERGPQEVIYLIPAPPPSHCITVSNADIKTWHFLRQSKVHWSLSFNLTLHYTIIESLFYHRDMI